jgi:hypothetical protein
MNDPDIAVDANAKTHSRRGKEQEAIAIGRVGGVIEESEGQRDGTGYEKRGRRSAALALPATGDWLALR